LLPPGRPHPKSAAIAAASGTRVCDPQRVRKSERVGYAMTFWFFNPLLRMGVELI
jgi:hypothetical protein